VRGERRILVFRVGHLGDTLAALPALAALRDAFPDARIALLTNTDRNNPHYIGAESVLPTGLIDEYVHYPSGEGFSGADLFKLLFRLRREKYDAVVYLMTRNRLPSQIKRDRLYFKLAGIQTMYGDRYLARNLLDPKSVSPLPPVVSEAQFLLDCLHDEGLISETAGYLKPRRIFGDADKSTAEGWLREKCGESFGSANLIAVAPGSKWESKVWGEDRFGSVVSRLIESKGAFPIVFGGAEDAEKGQRLVSRWGVGANAAGALSVREAAAALSHCGIYLGNDTGTMHLAASSGTRCVAVFAAVDFDGRWHPIGEGHTVLRGRVPCEGCSSPICDNDRMCLDMISEDAVFEACLRSFEG
jgi:ADP-heptose:LPS heptosyltransferase